MAKDNISDKWIKMYYSWCKLIKPLAPEIQLKIFQLFIDTICALVEGEERTQELNIPLGLEDDINNIILKLTNDYHQREELRKKLSEGGTKGMNNRWGDTDKKKYKVTLRDNLYRCIIYFPSKVSEFILNNSIPNINAYLAWCDVFTDYISSLKDKPDYHSSKDDLFLHFERWYNKHKNSNFKTKNDSYNCYLRKYTKKYPKYSKKISKDNIQSIFDEIKKSTQK